MRAMFISYGIIAVSLAMHAWKSSSKKGNNKAADGMTAATVATSATVSDRSPE